MIASVHIADVGLGGAPAILRARPEPARIPGLVYADTTVSAPLRGPRPALPTPGRVGLVAFWEDDSALDDFLARAPLAERLAGGFMTRLEPLRVTGGWTGLPPLVSEEQPVDPDERVAVLTYGRLRKKRVVPFLRTSSGAEKDAVGDQAMEAGIALARPPHIVATFSLWRTAREMKRYAYRGPGHTAALRAVRQDDFHHESMFVRFRPYGMRGRWDGVDASALAA